MRRLALISLLLGIVIIGIAPFKKLLPDLPLNGSEIKTMKPAFNVKDFISGKFQQDLEKFLSENIGLRSGAIIYDNQMNYSIFGDLSSKYSSKMVLGKNNWLFEKAYIDSYNGLDTISSEQLETKVKNLGILQKKLASYGKYCLFVITPSKVSVYPEYVKEKFLVNKHIRELTNYQKIIPLLIKYNINYIDGHVFMVNLKKNKMRNIYTKSGTHWSYYASYYFTRDLLSKIEKDGNRKMADIRCDAIKKDAVPFGYDVDLAALTNIKYQKSFFNDIYYYPQTTANSGNSFRPRVLIIGGSYLWLVLYYLDKHNVFLNRDFFYYYEKDSKYPEGTFDPINKSPADLKQLVMNKDIVLIEANEQTLFILGYGFIEDAIKFLN